MKRKKGGSIGLNLDSLLDTLTNVVGFLVILLALMQLGVGETVKKIQAALAELIEAATPEALAKAQDETAATEAKLAELEKQQRESLSQIELDRKSIAKSQKRVKKPPKVVMSEAELAALRERVEARNKESKELETQLATAVAEVAHAKAQLADAPAEQAQPSAKIVNLPNPRDPPKGAQAAWFLCREGRVVPVDLDGLQERAQKVVSSLLRGEPAVGGAPNLIPCDKLIERFNTTSLGDRYIRLRVVDIRDVPHLRLERKKGAGETADQIRRGNSQLPRILRVVGKENRYARFLVWPDSFEAYLAAREVVDEIGLPAGWEPHTEPDEWVVGFNIRLRCKDAPPLEPPAPPKAPPPGETPKPPPPPLPIDLVD